MLLDGGAHGPVEPGAWPRSTTAREQLVGDPAAGHGSGPHHQAGGVVELVEPHQQQVGQVVGQRPGLAGSAAATSSSVKNALPSARSTMPRIVASVSGPGCSARTRVADVGRRRAGRAGSRVDAGQPAPLGDGGAQRVAAVQVVAAVGRDDGDGRVEAPGEQEAEQLAGGLVGPVHVLEQQQQGRGAASTSSAACDRREQLRRGPWLGLSSAGLVCSGITGERAGHQPGDRRGRPDEGRRASVGDSAASRRTPR